VTGSCEHGIETSGSLKGSEFIEYPSDSVPRTVLHGVSRLMKM
jgi:hypothetical protein